MTHLFQIRQPAPPNEYAAVAHELNNLLTAISGYSQLVLAEDGIPPQVLQDVGEIAEASARAVALVRKLQSG